MLSHPARGLAQPSSPSSTDEATLRSDRHCWRGGGPDLHLRLWLKPTGSWIPEGVVWGNPLAVRAGGAEEVPPPTTTDVDGTVPGRSASTALCADGGVPGGGVHAGGRRSGRRLANPL